MIANNEMRSRINHNPEGYNHTPMSLMSRSLKRVVNIELFRPTDFKTGDPLLLMFDGQDWKALDIQGMLDKLDITHGFRRPTVVAIHAGQRMQEYGVAGVPDCRGRGARAADHAWFVVNELLPWLHSSCDIASDARCRYLIGCSLGGLTAFDLVWNYPEHFAGVAALSASFWWRSRDLEQGYTDQDRIVHRMVRMGMQRKGLKFWFQAGTRDETSDRNHNGIIDSIDDTLDLVTELLKKGYHRVTDVVYHEVKGGKHDLPTWKKVLPVAVLWLLQSAVDENHLHAIHSELPKNFKKHSIQ